MFHMAMNVPASLRCKADHEQSSASNHADIVVAQGPFIIMAYGYLSLSLEKRRSCWIGTATGNVLPDEIEEVMHRWHARTKLVAESDQDGVSGG